MGRCWAELSHALQSAKAMQQNAPGRSSDLLLLKFGASGLPVWLSQTVALWMPECSRSSQQRACSGISPDSLFTALAFRLGQHQMRDKGSAFCASVASKQSQNHFVQCCNVWIYIVLCVFLAHVFMNLMGTIHAVLFVFLLYFTTEWGRFGTVFCGHNKQIALLLFA